MTNINSRKDITNLLEPSSMGCELGVFEGEFSADLWNSKKFDQLYLVDIFSGKASNFGKSYDDASVLENIIRQKFIQDSGVRVFKSDSVTFLQSTPSNFFHFIYIDTTHTYETTVLELEESYRCIKNNGYICGHDYTSIHFPGVVNAVNEFCDSYSTEVHIIDQNEPYPSFYIKISK
jgi:hypothetical protein